MNVLTLDIECTISNTGNPFDQTNKLVCIGYKFLDDDAGILYDLDDCNDYYDSKEQLQSVINEADLLVGFNIKFDLHWLRRAGINFEGKRIWDCQLGEFILNYQQTPYPSLNQAAEKYGFELKLDVVKEEYWNKGIDTDAIPRDILSDYLAQDLILTEQVYLKQKEQFVNDSRYTLFKLQCFDLVVLEEMEWNGIKFATTEARQQADEIEHELTTIYSEIKNLVGDVPFNLNSNDHLSCILYGGTIIIIDRIPVGVFKTGAKVGEVRFKKIEIPYELPRLVDPLKGSETAKEGYWKVNDEVLRQLKLTKAAKRIVELITRYGELEKLSGTYLRGWSNLIDKMNWEKDMIHGNLNQCTVITGRLSSTKPNLQNANPETKTYCVSRYDV